VHVRDALTDTPIRFCPFCRESFEDVERCPSHDVALVSLRELGALAAADVNEDAVLPVWSLRQGRGLIALGAALTLLAFFCPMASLSGELHTSNTLWKLAHGRALRLWIAPTAVFALSLILYRRRSCIDMRSARLATLFVSLLPSALVIYTLLGAQSAADRLAQQLRGQVQLHIGFGAWLIWLAGVLLVWGSARFGVRRKPRVR
jgi:hypothetical protein